MAVLAALAVLARPAAEEPRPPEPPKPAKPKRDKPPEKKDPAAKGKHDPEVQYLLDLAHVHRQYGHLEEALPLLEKSLEKEDDADLRIDILQLAGETALAEPNRADVAAKYFTKAIEQCKDEERANVLRLWLGGAHRTAKDYPAAEAAFWSAYRGFAEKRQQQDALRQFSEIVRRPERAEAAVAEYEKRLGEKPGDLDLLEILSIIYAQGPKRDVAKALAVQEKISAARPDDLDEQQKLAALYQQAGQADKAVEMYRRIVEKRPEELEKLARALAQAGKKDEAAAAARKLLEGQESNPKVLENVAQLLEQTGSGRDALDLRVKSIGLMKEDREKTEARFRLVDRYRELKEFGKAEDLARGLLKEAAEAKPAEGLKADERKAYVEAAKRNLGRAKRLLVQMYEEQGRLEDLQF